MTGGGGVDRRLGPDSADADIVGASFLPHLPPQLCSGCGVACAAASCFGVLRFTAADRTSCVLARPVQPTVRATRPRAHGVLQGRRGARGSDAGVRTSLAYDARFACLVVPRRGRGPPA